MYVAAANTEPDRVDEDRGRSLGLAEVTFEDRYIERERVSIGAMSTFWGFQHDNQVVELRAVGGEGRDGGIGWILGKAAARLELQQIIRADIAGTADRPVGEDDCGSRHAIERKRVADKCRFAGIQHHE